jgi:hypothetical protein
MGPLNPHDYILVSHYTLYELRPANFPRISTTSSHSSQRQPTMFKSFANQREKHRAIYQH